MNPMATYESTT